MSIAGISSNFSALTTTDVQAEAVQYTEDTQLLTQTLETETLTNQTVDTGLLQAANLSNTTGLLSSLESELNAGAAESSALENTSTNTDLSTANQVESASTPRQTTTFGLEDSSNNNTQNTSAANSNTQSDALESLLQSNRATALQAYVSDQANGLSTGALNSIGTLLG